MFGQIRPSNRVLRYEWSLLIRRPIVSVIALALVAAFSSTCHKRDPLSSYDNAQEAFRHGDMKLALEDAAHGYDDFHWLSSDWAWKFRILEANALVAQGSSDKASALLASEPDPPSKGELAVQLQRTECVISSFSGDSNKATQSLMEAERLCAGADNPACSSVTSLKGWLAIQVGDFASAQPLLEKALGSARKSRNDFLEATALLNFSWSADLQTHFDEALDWAEAANKIALQRNFAGISQKALGNMGWAYYKLGDREKSEGMFIEAEHRAESLGETSSQIGWLTAAGYEYMDSRNFKAAEQAFSDSLRLAKLTSGEQDVANSLVALAFLSEATDKWDDAKRYANEALILTQKNGNGGDLVYPLFLQGRIEAQQRDSASAENLFRRVADSKDALAFLKWEAQRSLAHVYEDENQADAATSEYQTALSTFEAARSELRSERSNLTFLSNATRIYDDYIHLLISQGKIKEALQAADYDRARTLREGLGLVQRGGSFAPEPLDAQAIARHAGGTILFYWLGEKQSYWWVITPQASRLFPLNAPSQEIDATVRSYRAKLEGPPEILAASSDASTLYKMLIGPAQDFLTKEAFAKNNQVFIIPDDSLNSLNFETLMPAAQHYWIEDVTITSAGSLHLLAAARPAPKQLAGKLLLMGDPVPPAGQDEYARLPFAAQEVQAVARHFKSTENREFTGDQATSGAYLNGHPEQFSYIHFVAHGEASRASPLDSAIILSRDPASKATAGEDNSFKLYARDIIQHPLHADLVTISACYGAGKRSYSGEGLVGLSWAFLRAGAHNVVGALWDVSSISSAQLMDDFYGELQKGRSPSAALRAAKLKLLHSSNTAFNSPFYWAPFQLYTGASRSFPQQPAENNMR
jgi:CHAT domain-containing protein